MTLVACEVRANHVWLGKCGPQQPKRGCWQAATAQHMATTTPSNDSSKHR
eukprot:CAMPEP_0171094480 /NCGR_PEP_ID=MMETSP0766_2-20121228/41310_1 /TAXON_ID=439317 /ORGANISM="Gambierdiscus australes, Strain CAWD 149" /LENGTH=49 /DNA_ID= /DNA_START= /DNA_END= /DNA_ORIENTATION=